MLVSSIAAYFVIKITSFLQLALFKLSLIYFAAGLCYLEIACRRKHSFQTQDWKSWYWRNKSVSVVAILNILYVWVEFQDV